MCFTHAVENGGVIAREGGLGPPPGKGETWRRSDTGLRDTDSIFRGKAHPRMRQEGLLAGKSRLRGCKGLANDV